jgi:hypothetical protein
VNRAEVNLVRAMCDRAAQVWADGNEDTAMKWFAAAVAEVGDQDFVDDEPTPKKKARGNGR